MTGVARLLASGSNGTGQLGIGHVEDVSTWTPCSFAEASARSLDYTTHCRLPGRVLAIASGAGHAVLLLEENGKQGPSTGPSSENASIWTTGSNEFGQLGPNYPTSAADPVHNMWKRLEPDAYLRMAGLKLSPNHHYRPIHIACSWTTTFICFERQQLDGERWQRLSDVIISFGTNDFGELGADIVQGRKLEDTVHLVKLSRQAGDKRIISVRKMKASHRNIACIVDLLPEEGSPGPSESRAYGWGAGRHGQLHPKTGVAARSRIKSTEIPDGTPIPSETQGSGVAENTSKSRARRNNGGIKFKKSEYPSSLPTPTSLDPRSALELSPGVRIHFDDLAVGAGHTVLRVVVEGDQASNEIVGFGSNAKAQLAFVPLQSTRWGSIGCTWNGTMITALEPSHQIYTTGTNTHGQLGYDDLVPVAATAPHIFPTNKVALAVEMDWGQGTLEIVCGSEHTIVLAIDSAMSTKAWVWGWNEHGNLGLGDVTDRWTPIEVSLEGDLKIKGAWAGCGTSWLAVEETVDAMH